MTNSRLSGQWEVTNEETLVRNRGRIRDVRQGPDGYIYVAFDEGHGEIVRLEPVVER